MMMMYSIGKKMVSSFFVTIRNAAPWGILDGEVSGKTIALYRSVMSITHVKIQPS